MALVIGLAGSLRRASYNAALLAEAVRLAPPGLELEVASIHGIPLYDGDLEAEQGVPATVEALKERIVRADALLLVTPEYNNSLPGVMKNAVDWLTRPPRDIPRVFGGKPVALMGATPGAGGTALAQTAWLPVLRTLGTLPWFGPRVQVRKAASAFDDERHITDDELRSTLTRFLSGFLEFIERVKPRAEQ